MDFLFEFEKKINLTEQYLSKYFMENDNHQKAIYEAMKYSLLSGGKRIRPVLTLSCCELFGGGEEVMPFACALEMIHAYSLIHDDLPCMDNDDLRRGKPTNHVVYGEAMALLAGDGLLTRAFEVALTNSELLPNITVDALKLLSAAAGTEGMIGGQVIDMESEEKDIDSVTLMTMHLHKTGALIMAAAKIGALIGGATKEDILKMESFSRYLGIAFQIKDDILDVEGNEELLGKPVGSDKINHKTTFVTLYGIEQAKKMLEDYTLKAIEVISEYGEKADFLKEFSNYLLSRDR
ncbi:MAG: polyprenyl synthetase family protein [Ruminococcaceae bacterium]|nr:polyprenyl synthetase family protein [Oscillospiraceae bacterium]